ERTRVVVQHRLDVVRPDRVGQQVQVVLVERAPGTGGRQIGAEHQSLRVDGDHGLNRLGHVEVDAAETGRLDPGAAFDQREQVRQSVFGEPEVIDAHGREGAQDGSQVQQVTRVDVQLGVPPGDLVDTAGQGVQVIEGLRAAPAHVEPHRPYALRVQ